MSYRVGEPPKPKAHRTEQKLTTPMVIHATNGTIMQAAFPCWYTDVRPPKRIVPHNEELHNHLGWPSPNFPDQSCQPDVECCDHVIFNTTHGGALHPTHLPYHGHHTLYPEFRHVLDFQRIYPIHLSEEGYEVSATYRSDAPEDLEQPLAFIDEDDDWVVRVVFDATTEEADLKVVTVPFAVYAEFDPGEDGYAAKFKKRDVVAQGVLVIHPATVPEEV